MDTDGFFANFLNKKMGEQMAQVAQAFTSIASDVNDIADVVAGTPESVPERLSTQVRLSLADGPYETHAKLNIVGILWGNPTAAAVQVLLQKNGNDLLRMPLPANSGQYMALAWEQRLIIERGTRLTAMAGEITLWAVPE